ncbi:hypothetical protein HYT24_02335, partial [Candidatus Pacearchaeota archaeon]|nr:hypothetical protein [Candidatus Pacearchaeota archaeon]
MKMPNKPSVDDILKKYGNKIESKIQTSNLNKDYSREYVTFKQEMVSELSKYEKLAKSFGNVIKVKAPEKTENKLKRQLEIAHLDVLPQEAYSFSILSSVGLFFITFLISVSIFLLTNSFPFMFFILMAGVSWFLYYFVESYPERLANQWRLKASSQMVPALLYVVVYMRHTPNLEKAIAFAAEHLEYPLALDFRKVFYDVQIGRFSTLKESLDSYLDTWRDYSFEFIEAFHLIESSLFEPDEERRISTLERALQVVLEGVYDKMLKFTHDVRSPLTNVYMLTVVLPVLGIALLPLASVLVGGFLKWYHIFILYTLILPFMTLYFTDKIMLLRPGGYGETSFLGKNPFYPKYKSNDAFVTAAAIAFPIILIGLLPLIFQYTPLPDLLGIGKDFTFSEVGLGLFGEQQFFGFIESSTGVSGPFGMGALLLSLLVPFGIALFFVVAYNQKTKELIVERNK